MHTTFVVHRKWIRPALTACILAALVVAATTAQAGSDRRKGTSGALELQIPIGPRSTALGGAVAGDVTGIEAMFWNPAGLGGGQGTEAMFSRTDYFADMKLHYAGLATRMGGLGTLGFAAKVLSIGDIIVTTEAAPDGTGEILTPTFSVLGLSWGKAFTDRVRFGATANYVNESIANNSANGVAFDFGVQYETGWNGLKLGLVIKNIGTSMSYSGPGFEIPIQDPNADPNATPRGLSFSSTAFEMPSYFQLSSTYDVMRSPQQVLVAHAAFQNNNFSGDNVRGAMEWSYRETFSLRGSYFGTFNGTVDLASGDETFAFDSGDDLYQGFALGAGAQTRLGEEGTIGVDVAWRPVKEQFEDILELAVRIGF
jgi:hypothetical protein